MKNFKKKDHYMNNREKLLQLIDGQSDYLKDTKWRIENRPWLKKSAKIALKILEQMDSLNYTQEDMCKLSGWDPEVISQICSGKYDLKLSEITFLELILKMKIKT